MRTRFALPLAVSPRNDTYRDITPDVEPLVLGFREHVDGDALAPRERRVELALTAAFAVVVAAIALLFERRAVPAGDVVPLVLAYAVASRVTFPVGAGYT